MAQFNKSTEFLVDEEREHQELSSTPAQSSVSIPQYGTIGSGSPPFEEKAPHSFHPFGGKSDIFGASSDSPGPGAEFLYKVRQARVASENKKAFAYALIGIIVGSFLWIGCLFGTITVPVAMVIIGSLYMDQCPAIPAIPILLVTSGCLMTMSNFLNIMYQFSSSFLIRFDENRRKLVMSSSNVLFNLVIGVAFIMACIYVYGNRRPSHDPSEAPHFCHSVVYLFSFWVINFVWIFCAFLFAVAFIGCCCASFA
jgi:hypothetical protein